MLKPSLHPILYLLGLLGAIYGTHESEPTGECNIKAWVRAPDLAPNTIVQGDVRVKISAECPTVEYVSLGLRFKERSFVKVLRSREDVKWLSGEHMRWDAGDASPWGLSLPRFVNQSAQEAYEEVATNKDLWIVREEERMVFETTQSLDVGAGSHGALRDVVQDFSVLLPSTNFPPALDFLRSHEIATGPHIQEVAQIEWIYEYFAQISFENGTMKEVLVGVTAFEPSHDLARVSQRPTSATVELEPLPWGASVAKTQSAPVANYSVELDSETLFAGSKNHVVTGVLTRTGLARIFSSPVRITVCVVRDLSFKWATEYDIGISSEVTRSGWFSQHFCFDPYNTLTVNAIMPNSTTDEIDANKIVTTSTAFTASIDVNDAHVTDFETYYETLANVLMVNLAIPHSEDKIIDPDDPSGEPNLPVLGPQFDDDDEAWVPWQKQSGANPRQWRTHTGRIPVTVLPSREVLPPQDCPHASTDLSGQVVLAAERGCEPLPLIHYLDEGARGPVFVDPGTVHGILAEDPTERELRAPVLEPVTSSPPLGEERITRYYRRTDPMTPLIYVGETWAKKVAKEDEHQHMRKT